MKKAIELIIWRLTGWRELSKLLHAHFGHYDALTPIGLDRAEVLATKESQLMRRGRKKHWIEWIFKI